ncbi:MAG: hypothetical protein K2Z80_10485 [Xanthobacteraceae bacterium]|nr:hypothetical protein [Xanthobacteraceae bacterium]
MSLLGKGAVLVWCDIDPAAADEHERWHSYEHIPERLGVPGYLRVRRGISPDQGAPRIFVLYEVRDLDVVLSPAYMQRLNSPSAWTTRMMRSVQRLNRTPCRVSGSFGTGIGSHVAAIRISPEPVGASRLRHWLLAGLLPQVAGLPGVVGVHLLEADAAARGPNTREQALRGKRDEAADWVIVLEGFDRAAIREIPASHLAVELVAHDDVRGDIAVSVYELVHIAGAEDLASVPVAQVPVFGSA